MYAPAGGGTISHAMSGWLKNGSASAIILQLTSAKKCSQRTKIAQRKNCSQNSLTMSKFIVSKTLLNKFALGESNLLTENQFCSRRIMNCPSYYLQSTYGCMTRFLSTHKSKRRKFAHSKEKLLTNIKFALALLTAEICSQNLLAA
jgi:hypothetical protein